MIGKILRQVEEEVVGKLLVIYHIISTGVDQYYLQKQGKRLIKIFFWVQWYYYIVDSPSEKRPLLRVKNCRYFDEKNKELSFIGKPIVRL